MVPSLPLMTFCEMLASLSLVKTRCTIIYSLEFRHMWLSKAVLDAKKVLHYLISLA